MNLIFNLVMPLCLVLYDIRTQSHILALRESAHIHFSPAVLTLDVEVRTR